MTDGLLTGWAQAVWLLGYVLGALIPAALLLALVGAVLLLSHSTLDVPHRLRVHRIRRQTRQSGRETGHIDSLTGRPTRTP